MTQRANWKGFLKIAELSCPVALYAAASTSERIALDMMNRASGNRVHRRFVDAKSGSSVEREDQVKGYEIGKDECVVLEPDEIAAAVPESNKTLVVSPFIDRGEIDDICFDAPYYLTPSDRSAQEPIDLIREGRRAANVAAIARAVLFRRVRAMLIRDYDGGLLATTLNFDHEVRSSSEAFAEVPSAKITCEMLDPAEHIIVTKQGAFGPARFHDRHEAALAELVKAKLEGRSIKVPRPPKRQTRQDLVAALRESADLGARSGGRRSRAAPRGAVRKAS